MLANDTTGADQLGGKDEGVLGMVVLHTLFELVTRRWVGGGKKKIH